jgi:hypothetical protein
MPSNMGIISSSHRNAVLPSGRVAYYPGTVTSGNLVNALGSNGVGTNLAQVSGNKGNAVSFNGSSAYVDLNFNSNPANMTWAFWIKAPNASSGTLINNISYYATTTASFPLNTGFTTGNKLTTAWSKGDDYVQDLILISNAAIADNSWHFVAFTYASNSAVKIYVDGTLDNSASINFTISTSPFNWFIGRQAYIQGGGSAIYANAILDEISYYERVLSSTEVTALMNQGGS